MTENPYRILIVDDHPMMRAGLREIISAEPDMAICGEAADIPEALQQIRHDPPDIMIVDIALKGASGLELIKEVHTMDSQIKMLVLSMHDDTLYAERALRAGALGYVNKTESSDRIITAIRKVAHGETVLSPAMTDSLLKRVSGAARGRTTSIDQLSDRELEVLEGIGRGLTTRQIAEKLQLSIKTVETHRDKIKVKLSVKSPAELSRHAVIWVQESEGC